MADNVSFKVYLKDPSQGEETEVRRFVVDKEVSTSLVYIKEKPNYVRLLDAEGSLVYQSHYKVLYSRFLKMKCVQEMILIKTAF